MDVTYDFIFSGLQKKSFELKKMFKEKNEF